MRPITAGIPLLVAALAASTANAQRPLNLGIETSGVVAPILPWGWYGSDPYGLDPVSRSALDTIIKREGRQSLRVHRTSASAPLWWASSDLAAKQLRGNRLTLSGWIRTRDLRNGSAGLRIESTDKSYTTVHLDTASITPGERNSEWTKLIVATTVDTNVVYLSVGAQISGAGTAWVDDLVLKVNGKALTTSPAAPRPTSAERQWLRSRTRPFDPGTSGRNVDAFSFLNTAVNSASVVSLGEGTHGTREFFEIKRGMIEYLVTRMGFRTIMLEANQLAAERLNRYVLYGEGDPSEVLRGLFRVLQTEEILGMVEWARELNRSGKGRVEIVGYDMQNPLLPIDSLRAFFARVDPSFVNEAESDYGDIYRAWSRGGYPARPDSVVTRWSKQALRVVGHVRDNEASYLSLARNRSDTSAVQWAVQNARVLHQSATLGDQSPLKVRDSSMAENIAWVVKTRAPGQRHIVWAHNGHVARQPEWMGAYLEKLFPGRMRVFGFTTAQGTYGAARTWVPRTSQRSYGQFPIVPDLPPAGGVGRILYDFKYRNAVVDLRGAENHPGGNWLAEDRPFLSIGGAAVDYGYSDYPLRPSFDYLIYSRSTTASRPLPGGVKR